MATDTNLRVLVAEDDLITRRLLVRALEQGAYAVETARDGQEAWDLLSSANPPQLAVLDWMMPKINGIEICRRLRSDSERPYCYVIMLTANTSTADLVEALDAGADDFIPKPFKDDEVRGRLRVGQRMVNLQHELHRRGSYDELTGLLNRRTFLEAFQRVGTRAALNDSALGLAMLDIDHFKRINDVHGHQAGDAVLREVAARLTTTVRPTDLTCRFGGEEFVIAMPGCSIAVAGDVGERLRAAIADVPIALPDTSISVTVSIGVTVAAHSPHVAYEHLLNAADRALYTAKASGRNRVELAAPFELPVS
ncbi:MAG: diguanylate cyclase [Vicinamibacterales bacterium]